MKMIINRDITVSTYPFYRMYIKRITGTENPFFEIKVYGFDTEHPFERPDLHRIEPLPVSNNSFGVSFTDKNDIESYEYILWDIIHKDISKDLILLSGKLKLSEKANRIKEQDIIIIKEIEQIKRKLKLERILK